MGEDLSSTEYVVVGSGSTGSSIAYNLARMGKRVTVVERNGVASGNTGKSSALVRTHYSNKIIASMSLFSLKVFKDFNKIGYSGYTKTGTFFPFGQKYASIAMKNSEMLRALGIDEQEVSRESIRKFYPDANLDGYDFVAYEPDSGYADPVSTSNAFMDKARELGATLILKKKATCVESSSNGTFLYLEDGSVIRASKIILATNVWTNDLLSQSGVSRSKLLPITASLHHVIYLRRPEEYRGIRPTLFDPPSLAYYKMEGTSVTAIGSLDPKIDNTPVDIHGDLPEGASDEYLEDYLQRITSRLPAMGKAGVISTITGIYDMTPDGQAIIDSLSSMGLDSVYVCAGLSGHGFKLSPAYGKIVSEMVTDTDPEKAMFDWRPFSKERFASGKLIKSLYSEVGTIY
ncbi:MAG: NAD(P)/FAD-dependent oxidoreductase [Thermoplasmataceae archaeon]